MVIALTRKCSLRPFPSNVSTEDSETLLPMLYSSTAAAHASGSLRRFLRDVTPRLECKGAKWHTLAIELQPDAFYSARFDW